MKQTIIYLFLTLFMFSCNDDSWKEELEEIRTELANQRVLIEALQNKAFVEGIERDENGYTILFSNGQSITLNNGETPSISIGNNGNWYINGKDTGKPSQGAAGNDGSTPIVSIGDNGNWYINGEDTGKPSQGAAGNDGKTPLVSIGDNGNWYINGEDTGKPSQGAAGIDGKSPVITIGNNGNWIINQVDTGVKAEGTHGQNGKDAPSIVAIIEKADSLIFKFSDNTEIKVPLKTTASSTYNPPLDLKKETLRVLDIGNSYTEDATHYLPLLVQSSGINVSDMCLYRAIRGGASFKNWYDIYCDKDTTASYGINKVFGGLNANTSGIAAKGNGEKFRNILSNNEWDLILIHQVSTYAPYYERWEENSNAGHLSDLIRIIRKHQPNATIGFLLVHSYWDGYSGNKEKSSLERWKLIAESAKKLSANYNIDFIIPYGTAIENLRASSLNNEYDLTIDGTHCASGLADYTAACCYFQSLVAPRYGVSILGNTARWTNNGETGKYPNSIVDVTDDNALIAQKAAFVATYNWDKCINPETVVLP